MNTPGRLFVAVFPPEPLLEEMVRAQSLVAEQVQGFRFTPPQKMHLTLRFFGSVEASFLPQLAEGIAQALQGVEPFTLTCSGWGAFPNVKKPRVLWLGTRADPLDRLAHALAQLPPPLTREESLPFRPHITMARAREAVAPPLPDRTNWPIPPSPWEVRALHLVSSQTGKSGSEYVLLRAFALVPQAVKISP